MHHEVNTVKMIIKLSSFIQKCQVLAAVEKTIDGKVTQDYTELDGNNKVYTQ